MLCVTFVQLWRSQQNQILFIKQVAVAFALLEGIRQLKGFHLVDMDDSLVDHVIDLSHI